MVGEVRHWSASTSRVIDRKSRAATKLLYPLIVWSSALLARSCDPAEDALGNMPTSRTDSPNSAGESAAEHA